MRINILSSRSIYNRDYVYNQLSKYITSDKKIAVVAFSFFLNGHAHESYLESYRKPLGKWYLHIIEPFLRYGLKEENFDFILYNHTSKEDAKKIIDNADIVFLPGGAPDLFFERLEEYNLVDVIRNLDNKIVMGPSAGTMVQFNWFHISKDYDYKKYMLSDGLGLINDFGVEVHFRRRKQQKKSIRRVSHFNPRPIYTITDDGFMILEDGVIKYSYMADKYYEDGKKLK